MAQIHIMGPDICGKSMVVPIVCHVPISNKADQARLAETSPVTCLSRLNVADREDIKLGRIAEFVRVPTFGSHTSQAEIQRSAEGIYKHIATSDVPVMLLQLAKKTELDGSTFDGKRWS